MTAEYTGTDYKFPDESSEEIEIQIPADDNVVIEPVDDTPEEDRNRKPLDGPVEDPTDEELQTYSDKVQERIKKLTHARHDERRKAEQLQRERDELEAYARTVSSERDRLRQQAQQGATIVSQQALSITDADIAEAKAALKRAHEEFDTDAIVEAQTKLQQALVRKGDIERIRAAQATPVATQPQSGVQYQPTAPAAPRLDQKTQAWLSKNKWFGEGGDKALTGFALGLHQQLVEEHGDGYAKTDEYYSRIDDEMRKAFPSKFGVKKAPPSTAAPVSRVGPGGKRVVQLTHSQLNIAKRLGLTPQQYAAELLNSETNNGR